MSVFFLSFAVDIFGNHCGIIVESFGGKILACGRFKRPRFSPRLYLEF